MKRLLLIAFISIISVSAPAEEYYNESFYYSIELAPGFELLDDTEAYNVMFQNSSGEAFFEVTVIDLEAAETNAELFEEIANRFGADGTYKKIKFVNYEAAQGTLKLVLEDVPLVLDMVAFKDDYYFYMLMAYSTSDSYKRNKGALASITKSFKIHYDNTVYSNDSETVVPEPDNKTIEKKNTEYDSKGKGEYDELRASWDKYKQVYRFLKSDFYKARDELNEISSGDSWDRYGVDPYGPDANKNFWHKFYLDMYKRNYYRVNPLYEWFAAKSKAEGWNQYTLATEIIKALQSVQYGAPEKFADEESEGSRTLGFFTPNEVAHYNTGDCDTKSLFIVILLKRFGFDAVMYYSEIYAHAMLGLNINATGYYKVNKGKKYYFVESTYPGWQIGQISEEWSDVDNWYLLPIN